MTQHHPDDKDFALNRFEELPDKETQQHQESPFEREFMPEGRHEPIIKNNSQIDDESSFGDLSENEATQPDDISEKITAPAAPQMGSDFPSEQKSTGKGSTMATAFAIVAVLIAAGSAWLNFDQAGENRQASDTSEQAQQANDKHQLSPGYNTMINDEIRKLRERTTVIELEKNELNQKLSQQSQLLQRLKQQNQKFVSQIKGLETDIRDLSNKLSDQQKLQTQAKLVEQPVVKKTVSKPAPAKKSLARKAAQYELPAPLESLPAGSKAASDAGWVINLASVYSATAANKELTRFQAMGINAEVAESMVKGKQIFRLRVAGFANREEARMQKEKLTSKHGIKDAWIHKP